MSMTLATLHSFTPTNFFSQKHSPRVHHSNQSFPLSSYSLTANANPLKKLQSPHNFYGPFKKYFNGFPVKACGFVVKAQNESGFSDDMEKEEMEARGQSTMPERFRYLTKEVPEKPVRWPWLIVSEAAVSASDPETESPGPENEPAVETAEEKHEGVFAVVMVGSRQYIVFPGRYLYTQRLRGANVNDKITLNKVLLVGTKTSAYIGKPIVPNARVEAIVEEQKLDKKVIVFKYKKKKHYRRNIGHRQPITRIRITSIRGYQDSPAVTLP